jgi:hypothetical protein
MNYTHESKNVQNSQHSNQNYIIKLERNSKDLEQLQSKLNRYIYEPKTRDLFERKSVLISQLKRLKRRNLELIIKLKNRKDSLENQFDIIKEQFSEFVILETNIKAYYMSAHSH